jgi:hypothetical protein
VLSGSQCQLGPKPASDVSNLRVSGVYPISPRGIPGTLRSNRLQLLAQSEPRTFARILLAQTAMGAIANCGWGCYAALAAKLGKIASAPVSTKRTTERKGKK